MKPRALLQSACLAGSARAALWARGYNNNTTATNINNSYSNSNTMGGGRFVNATAPVYVNNTAATTANDNNTTPDKSGVEDIGSGGSSSSSSSSTDDLSSAVGVTATLGGYTIPRDLPDGHYTIALHPNGTALHTLRWHAPSRRWHTLHRRAGGTGEYTFLVDDAHLARTVPVADHRDDVEELERATHRYQRALKFQIWHDDGMLVLRSPNAPTVNPSSSHKATIAIHCV